MTTKRTFGIVRSTGVWVCIALLVGTPGLLAHEASTANDHERAAPPQGEEWRVLPPGADWRSVIHGWERPVSQGSGDGAPPPGGSVVGGTELWSSRYEHSSSPGYGWAIAHDVTVADSGDRVFVTGESILPGSWQKFVTVAYDAVTGAELWESRYSGDSVYSEVATTVVAGPDASRVYVTGYGQSVGYGWHYTTIAYDGLTGEELWVSHYRGGMSWDWPLDMMLSPDGERLYVTGLSQIAYPWYFQFATVAYDAATGDELWVARHSAGLDDQATALGLSSDGETLFVGGLSRGASTGFDYLTIAYDAATGTERWSARYDGPASDWDTATGLAVAPDDAAVYITGESAGDGTGQDFATVAYDAATGGALWTARFDAGGAYWDRPNAVGVAPDGSSVFVAGWGVVPSLDVDYATVAYDAATGATRWSSTYSGPGGDSDFAEDMVVDPSGTRVYVTGQSWGAGSAYDFTTVAYSAEDGASVWTAAHDGVGSRDYGRALALDPLNLRLFGTGMSRNAQGDLDYLTLAYVLDEMRLVDTAVDALP